MAEKDPSFNDNLLDQEIESEMIPGEDDMDIDLAIENALDDLDGELSLDDMDSSEPPAINDDELGALENLLEGDSDDLTDVDDISNLDFDNDETVSLEDDSDIPVINDVFDPKQKAKAGTSQATSGVPDKDLLKQIISVIEEVVDESVQAEVEKISASLKHQVNKKLKTRLTEILKGK